MGKALFIDLRRRILAMTLSGSSCRAAAHHFGVGESSAIRLRRRYLTQGTIEPERGTRSGYSKLNSLRDYILNMIKEQPDLTLEKISRRIFEEKDIKVSIFCV